MIFPPSSLVNHIPFEAAQSFYEFFKSHCRYFLSCYFRLRLNMLLVYHHVTFLSSRVLICPTACENSAMPYSMRFYKNFAWRYKKRAEKFL